MVTVQPTQRNFSGHTGISRAHRAAEPRKKTVRGSITGGSVASAPKRVMHLKDRLANPDISFDVRLPSVDEGTRTQVNSVLGEPDEMNRQVFSLIVLNRFLPVDRLGAASGPSGGRTNVVGTSGSELLSNQVSNWLSRLSNDVDLGFNYRPGDALTQDELEVAVSTQLFDERLVLSTNVGVQYGSSSARQSNALVGDFLLEYLMTNDGRIRVKAFSQSNDRNLNQADQAATTQGAGLAYREDFDTLGELWRNFKGMLGFKPRSTRLRTGGGDKAGIP